MRSKTLASQSQDIQRWWRLCSPPLRALPPARLRLGAAGCGRSARFPGTVTLTVLWQVSTGARPSTAFLEKLARRRSSAARRTPSPVAQNWGQRAADAPGSFCKLPPPAGARARAQASVRGGGAEPRTHGPTRWAGEELGCELYTPSPPGLQRTGIISRLSITMPANGAFHPVLTLKGSLAYEFSPLRLSCI